MIEKHEDGLEKMETLKSKYDLEIELLCLNDEFMSPEELKRKLIQYETLQKDFPQVSVLKESEFMSDENQYFEMSLFCNQDDREKFSIILNERGITVDIVHSKD